VRIPSRFPRLGGAAELSSGLLVDLIAPQEAQQELPLTPATELRIGDMPRSALTAADGWMTLGDIHKDDLLFYDFVINPDTFEVACDEFFLPSPPETFFIKYAPT
jgi:hypothetical protein